jgi:predicted anti-sigma-YlaC factor YlaD
VITCEQFMADLGDYLEGQSAEEVRQQLEFHLSQCRICQVIYDSTCKTVKIVTEAGSFDLPQDISEAITERIMAKLRSDGDKPLSKKPGV